MSNAGGNGEGASNLNRMSHAARGMFPYIATEKDCTDDEGREAECIICLEDFEAGDRMARLVCWCKFHEVCILPVLHYWLHSCFKREKYKTNNEDRNASRNGGTRRGEARVRRINCKSKSELVLAGLGARPTCRFPDFASFIQGFVMLEAS